MDNILEIRDLSKSFGGHKVLKGLSLSIQKGETLSLVGESGSGKTTLAKIVLGLIQQDAGEILLDGKDINYTGKEITKKMQFISQDPIAALSPRIKMGDLLREAGMSKRSVIEKLKDVGLSEVYYDRYAHQLSGGEAQRVCIARALAMEPILLILDEPLSSLDGELRDKIMQLLSDIKRKNSLTYLLITHDIGLAAMISDTIAVLMGGNIIEIGNTKKVLARPITEYTKLLIDASL